MKINCLKEDWIIAKGEEFVNVFEKVQLLTQQQNSIVTHCVIDNKEYYTNYLDHILHHFEDIKNVKFVCIPVNDYFVQLIISARDYLNRAVPLLTDLGNNLYSSNHELVWDAVLDFIDGFQWILNFCEILDRQEHTPSNIKLCKHKLEKLVVTLEKAIESKDYVQLADNILYEIIPIYQELSEILSHDIGYGVN